MAGLLPFFVRSPRALACIERLNQLLIIVGLAVLGSAGWQLAQLTMDQTLPALDVSAGPVYLTLPVALAAAGLVHLAQLFAASPAAPKESRDVYGSTLSLGRFHCSGSNRHPTRLRSAAVLPG